MPRGRALLTAGVLAVPVIVLAYVTAFWTSMSRADLSSEATNYPRGLIIALVILVVMASVRDMAVTSRAHVADVLTRAVVREWRRTILTVVLLLAFVVSLSWVNFYIAATLFSFAMLLALGMRRLRIILPLTALYVGSAYVLFSRILQVRLPGA